MRARRKLENEKHEYVKVNKGLSARDVFAKVEDPKL